MAIDPAPHVAPHQAKLLAWNDCAAVAAELRGSGKKIGLCHGVFDLLHPGHVAHLQEARALVDVLFVSITTAPLVNRGPGRPFFSDDLRAMSLAALEAVDYVLVAPAETAIEVIDQIRPEVFCKGHEFADPNVDVTRAVGAEGERVRHWGGEIRHTGSVVFSSTRLLNTGMKALPPAVASYAAGLGRAISLEGLRHATDGMRKLRVLVLGEVIVDEFVFCRVQGLTSKGREVSARYLHTERHAGGALAIARHIAQFAGETVLAGVVGESDLQSGGWLRPDDKPVRLELVGDNHWPTIVKRRYVEQQGVREEYSRLFSVNYLVPEGPSQAARRSLVDRLTPIVDDCDLVLVADYGHGLLDSALLDLVQSRAPFLAVRCQTNTANHGFNLITKYDRADTFCLDEQELRLAFASRGVGHVELMRRLERKFLPQQCWLTLGSQGSWGVDADGGVDLAPALVLDVSDTTGAQDAFYALASLAARERLPLCVGSFLGNLAGALAANWLGNARAVDPSRLLKFATTVMKV